MLLNIFHPQVPVGDMNKIGFLRKLHMKVRKPVVHSGFYTVLYRFDFGIGSKVRTGQLVNAPEGKERPYLKLHWLRSLEDRVSDQKLLLIMDQEPFHL